MGFYGVLWGSMGYCGVLWGTAVYCWVLRCTAGYSLALLGTGVHLGVLGVMTSTARLCGGTVGGEAFGTRVLRSNKGKWGILWGNTGTGDTLGY